MSRRCQVTEKVPKAGKKYSFRGIAKKKKGIGLKITGISPRRFLPNLKKKRIYVPSEKRFITLRVSTKGLRDIDKLGIDTVLRTMRARGESV